MDTPEPIDAEEEAQIPNEIVEPEEKVGFFEAIANFFVKIFEWFKGLFKKIFG